MWVVRAAMYWSQPPSTTRESTLIVLLSSGRRQWRDCAHSSNRRTRSKAPTHGSSAFDDTRNTLMTKPNLSSNDIREEISEEMRADYLRQAQRLADECRSIIKREVGGGRLETTVKQDGSLVSSGDKAAEKAFRERVHGLFPDAGIIGDEYYHSNPNPKADFQWIIDPIDGTTEFVHGIPVYGTIIALHYKGKPLVGLIDHSAIDVRCCGAFGLGVSLGDRKVILSDFEPESDGSERLAISAPDNLSVFKKRPSSSFESLTSTRTFVSSTAVMLRRAR